MNSKITTGCKQWVFTQWTRKSYALFSSLKRIIKIGRLAANNSLISLQQVFSCPYHSFQPEYNKAQTGGLHPAPTTVCKLIAQLLLAPTQPVYTDPAVIRIYLFNDTSEFDTPIFRRFF